MARTIALSKEELAALDGLIDQFKADAMAVPAVITAVAAVVGAGAAVVGAVTQVVEVVQGGMAAGDRDPLEIVAADILQGKLSAEDLIRLRNAAVLKQ
jgi:pilus assembly protein TadC